MYLYFHIRKLLGPDIKVETRQDGTIAPISSEITYEQIREVKRQIRLNRALHHSHDEHIQHLKRGFNPHMN